MRHQKIILTLAVATLLTTTVAAAERPRLIINIVVSQMGYDDLNRFESNFTQGGFKRFMDDGVRCTGSYYNYMPTTTVAGLATLTTGANPDMHGVVSTSWFDYVTSRRIDLIADPKAEGLYSEPSQSKYSSEQLFLPTVGDKLLSENPASKVVTIAADPYSAVVMGGCDSPDVYWFDQERLAWVTSSAYTSALPDWVEQYNSRHVVEELLMDKWPLYMAPERYVNHNYSFFEFAAPERVTFREFVAKLLKRQDLTRRKRAIMLKPSGNAIVLDFARDAIVHGALGEDENVDVLNICFDTPRYVSQACGVESMETEDMYYRLDAALATFMDFVSAQFPANNVLFTLTSDHGASDSYDLGEQERDRFNTDQFKVIMGSFLSAQFGGENWVLDYADRNLCINRNQAYSQGLSLQEVQMRAAIFALQFRGVSHALTGTALASGTYAHSLLSKMQNGYYAKRSGDVVINYMPAWIEVDESLRSVSGSPYDYDTHVPLYFYGCGMRAATVNQTIDMTSFAPTLARIMHISRPMGSTSEAIEPIVEMLEQ